MADVAISGLTALGAAPATTDLIPLVDVSDTTQALTGTTKKMTVANLFTAPHFTTPVVDSGGLTVTSGNLTVPSGTMTAGSQISTTTGSLEARGAVFSYTDLVGAYAEYVSGTTQARLGAKHPTAAGLVLATVTGGAKVDALTFTAAGAATFAVGLTVSAGGLVVTGGGQFSRTAATDTNVVIDAPTGNGGMVRFRDAGTDKWLVGKAAASGTGTDYEIYNAALGALAFKITAAASTASFSGIVQLNTTVSTSASAGDLVLPNVRAVRGVTATGTDTFSLIKSDSNNYVVLGSGTMGTGPVKIPYDVVGSFSAGSAANNGVVGIDSTNNRLVYYSGGNRYFIAGTAF